MQYSIFESSTAVWALTESQIDARINLWEQAGITIVYLQVDEGDGASWPSTLIQTRPGADLTVEPLRRVVSKLRARGMSVIFVFNLINYSPWFPIHPEFLMAGATTPYYDVWNTDFTTWRANYIAECVSYCTPDAVAIDYLRSGRAAINETTTAEQAVEAALVKIRSTVDQSVALYSMNNSVHALPNPQGIAVKRWYSLGLITNIVLFNYAEVFPLEHLADLQAQSMNFSLLSGTYSVSNGAVVPKAPEKLEKTARRALRGCAPTSYGWYLASIFTTEQAHAISNLKYQLR